MEDFSNLYPKKREKHSSEHRRNIFKKARIHAERHVNHSGKKLKRKVTNEDVRKSTLNN